jgi:hypothetical protein
MPCHDILVATKIKEATLERIFATESMWKYWQQSTGLIVPQAFSASVGANNALMLTGFYSVGQSVQDAVSERYQQTYVAQQIFAGLAADGYEMHADVSPEHENTWVITARDVARNATIGVTVFKDLSFEIDFLDALHDDSVWLAGGEFGRVLEYLKIMGLSVEIIKQDIDDEARRQIMESAGVLA